LGFGGMAKNGLETDTTSLIITITLERKALQRQEGWTNMSTLFFLQNEAKSGMLI